MSATIAKLRSFSDMSQIGVAGSPPKFDARATSLVPITHGSLKFYLGEPGAISHVSHLPPFIKIPIHGPKQDFPETVIVPDGVFHALAENPYERDFVKHGKRIVGKLQDRSTTNGKAVAFVDQKGNIWKGDSHTTDDLRARGRIPPSPSGKLSLDVYYIGEYHEGEDCKTSEMLALYNQFNSKQNVKTAQDNLTSILNAIGFDAKSSAWTSRGTMGLRLADAVLNGYTLPNYDQAKDVGDIAPVWLDSIRWHDGLAAELPGAGKWNGGRLAAPLLTHRKFHNNSAVTEFWTLVAAPPESSTMGEQYNVFNTWFADRMKKHKVGNVTSQVPVLKAGLQAFERWRTGDPNARIKLKDYMTN